MALVKSRYPTATEVGIYRFEDDYSDVLRFTIKGKRWRVFLDILDTKADIEDYANYIFTDMDRAFTIMSKEVR